MSKKGSNCSECPYNDVCRSKGQWASNYLGLDYCSVYRNTSVREYQMKFVMQQLGNTPDLEGTLRRLEKATC